MQFRTVVFLVSLLLVPGLARAQEPPTSVEEAARAERRAATDTLRAFFEAISAFNYQKVRDLTTEDVVIVEDGPVLPLDAFLDAIRKLEKKEATITYELSDIEMTVEGAIAWGTYTNRGVAEMGPRRQRIRWTESVVLRKEAGAWKIAMLHSTVGERSSPDPGGGR
jgi:ketosteroid isomerase-like protein